MEGRISYIKKNWARHSVEALLTECLALGLWCGAFWLAVTTNGNLPLYGAAMALCGVILAMTGAVLGIMALFDKDKKYLLARVSLLVGVGIAVASAVVVFIS